MNEQNEVNDEESWGWNALGEEDISDPATSQEHTFSADKHHPVVKSASDRSLHGKRNVHTIMGIASSPSFQELERAIGATLANNYSNSEESMEQKVPSPNGSLLTRVSSTNLTQQKVFRQRIRQFQSNQRILNNFGKQYHFSHPNQQSSQVELSPFINESESRALILFHSPNLSTNAIRDVCSKYGVLYYIRPEFHHRGVTFISYFDLQAATKAKETLASQFGIDAEVSCHFSIMLHATNSNTEEYRLIVKNLPSDRLENEIQSIFARYGQLRSIQKTFSSSADLVNCKSTDAIAYNIEFFNIQDARLAASELSATSCTLWGPETSVKFAPLDERKQQLCRQLLAILSRWRTELTSGNVHALSPPAPMVSIPSYPNLLQMMNQLNAPPVYPVPAPVNSMVDMGFLPPSPLQSFPYFQTNFFPPQPTHYATHFAPRDFRIPFSDAEEVHNGHFQKGARTVGAGPTSGLRSPSGAFPEADLNETPHYLGYVEESAAPSKNLRKGNRNAVHEKGNSDFTLDAQKIVNGEERRTTVMVRNIPNKYSQRMLLEEVNVNHQGKYDFFYLPIDFKNRCNVGYCFINFIEPAYITAFVKDFEGQRWKSFNSEKVCTITFARIQGKNAMISRFQNSTLLEKDNEYKPLLFYSSGPEIGQPEPFPFPSQKRVGTGNPSEVVEEE